MRAFLVLFLISSTLCIDGLKPDIPGEYEIAPWHGFKTAAITYSFDDSLPNHTKIAIPLLEKYGYRGSFNVITGEDIDWDGFKEAAENGHEIGSHTITHPNIPSLDEDEQEREARESKETIEKKIGQECITYIYPECVRGNMDIVKKYYIAGRTCDDEIIGPNPKDMFDLSSFSLGEDDLYMTAEDMNKLADKALDAGKWIIFLMHGIDNDGGYSNMNSEDIESHLIYVKEVGEFWVATFKEVVKYMYEANSLIIDEKEADDGIQITVDCGYKTELTVMDVPVTVSRDMGEELENVKIVEIGDEEEEVKVKVDGKQVIFDVVPGKKYLLTYE